MTSVAFVASGISVNAVVRERLGGEASRSDRLQSQATVQLRQHSYSN